MLGLQCIEAPLEPVAPTSDVQLSIPLINRTKYLYEFSSKDTLLKNAADGSYYYASTQSIAPIRIDTIKASPKSSFQQVTLGTFQVDPPPPMGDTLTYKEITGTDPPPIPIVAPAQTVSIPSTTSGPTATFQNVTFDKGTITLRIRNNFPVPIDFPDPIILKNNKLSSPVDTGQVAGFSFVAKTFQPGEESTVSANLANVTMQTLLRVASFRMHVQGSSSPVLFTSQSGLQYAMTLSGLSARSALAMIPSQAVLSAKDSVFTVDDSVSLQSAFFRSGTFDVVLTNNIDVNVNVYLKFNEFQDKTTGAPFTINNTFNGKGTLRVPVNAANLQVRSSSTAIGSRITFTAGIQTIESQQPRQVNSTDFFRVDLQPRSTFVLQSVTGRIKPTRLAINAGASGADFGDVSTNYKGDFTFDSIRVALRLGITGGFPTDYDLRLVAMNRKVSPVRIDSISVPAPLGSALKRIYPGPGSITQIVLDNSTGLNKFFARFFPNFPDTFIVRGSVTMNPSDVFPTAQGLQSIYDTSKVYSAVDLSFPLKLAVVGGEVTDTADIGSGEKFPKDFVKSVKSGTVYLEVVNGLPIQLTLRAALLGRSAPGQRPDTLLWIPTDGTRTIAAAPIDQNGLTAGSKTTAFSITLMGSEIDKFNDANTAYFKLQVVTTGGGTTPVKVRSSDFVTIRASANMVYTANKK